MSMRPEEIIRTAVFTFGPEKQKMMDMEECSELINALAKEKRGRVKDDDVITEIADVMIMMEQLAVLYGRGLVEAEKSRKLERLEGRIRKVMEE